MKLSGGAVPLRRRCEQISGPSLVAVLAATGIGELLVTHDVAAMADIGRAAFFAARAQSADVSVPRTGA
jgi:hypothetical protein